MFSGLKIATQYALRRRTNQVEKHRAGLDQACNLIRWYHNNSAVG